MINVIICNGCRCRIDDGAIVIKRKMINIESKGMEIAYFKCPWCGKAYITEVRDYTVEKKKKRYDKVVAGLRRKQALGIRPKESRIREAMDLKDDLISYAMKLKDKYKDLIPREMLD